MRIPAIITLSYKIFHINALARRKTNHLTLTCLVLFFCQLGFITQNSQFTGKQEKSETISLTPIYLFHPLQRKLDINRTIIAGSSNQYIASSWSQTKNLWFTCASPQSLSYAPCFA